MNLQGLTSILSFIKARTNHKTLLIITSAIIGILSGLIAVFLKKLVLFLHTFVHWINDFSGNYLYFIFPTIGILLCVAYVRVFHKGKLGRGIPNILNALLNKNGNVEKDKMYSHVISSALTVGFGGSVGLEGPIVVTGSAIGSNTGRWFGFSGNDKKILLACGAAAGTAAIFNAPIAGVIFAIEVLLPQAAITSFIPLLVATASAAVVSNVLYQQQIFFLITNGWQPTAIPFYILLGIFCGLVSVYVTRMNGAIEKFARGYENPFLKAVVGGSLLGLLIFLVPPLYGEGYNTINALLTGDYKSVVDHSLFEHKADDAWFLFLLTGGMMFVKIIAKGITTGSGGNGGIFAPSLLIGAAAGFSFARFFSLTGLQELLLPNFIVAGMAGILSGVLHAPLTGIFLIAEVTGGYTLFIPLMIVSALSFFIARFFEPESVYYKDLKRKTIDKKQFEKVTLKKICAKDLLETDFATLNEKDSFKDLIESMTQSKRNVFPVLNDQNKLIGVILLDDIRPYIFDKDFYDKPVTEFLATALTPLHPDMPAYQVITVFDRENAWSLPVVENGIYHGFVSKSRLLQAFRENVKAK